MYALQCMVSFEDVYNCLYSLFFWENTQKGRVIFLQVPVFGLWKFFPFGENLKHEKEGKGKKSKSQTCGLVYFFDCLRCLQAIFFFSKELYICTYRVLSGQVFFEKGGIPR